MMHPTSRTCLTAAIPLIVVGVITLAYGPDIYAWIAEVAGFNAEAGLFLVSLLLTIAQWVMIPIAASLIGAAVVIQALSRDDGDHAAQE